VSALRFPHEFPGNGLLRAARSSVWRVGDQRVHGAGLIPFIRRPNRMKEDRPCTQSEYCRNCSRIRLPSPFEPAKALIGTVRNAMTTRRLTLSRLARGLPVGQAIKHCIKRVDRLLSNRHSHNERSIFYRPLCREFMFEAKSAA
jgi:hypothetical protein